MKHIEMTPAQRPFFRFTIVTKILIGLLGLVEEGAS